MHESYFQDLQEAWTYLQCGQRWLEIEDGGNVFSAPKGSYEDANTLPLEVDGGVVTLTQAFKYLWSLVTRNLAD